MIDQKHNDERTYFARGSFLYPLPVLHNLEILSWFNDAFCDLQRSHTIDI
jgi:hypothetical protein